MKRYYKRKSKMIVCTSKRFPHASKNKVWLSRNVYIFKTIHEYDESGNTIPATPGEIVLFEKLMSLKKL